MRPDRWWASGRRYVSLLAGSYVRATVEDAWERYYDVYRQRSLGDLVRFR